MGTRLLCPALDAMLKKTIIALCEVNVQYNLTLEISGSLHIRADGERVFNCLIEEELNGTGKSIDGLSCLLKNNHSFIYNPFL